MRWRVLLLLLLVQLPGHVALSQGTPQPPPPQDPAALQQRVSDRLAALQRESDRLAAESRTLIGDLRQLEIARDIQRERARQADSAVAEAEAAVQEATARLTELESQREAQLPDLKLRLVDLYKRGRTGYMRLLVGADSVRELARATRAVASLSRLTQLRIDEHRRTLAAVRSEQEALRARAAEVQRQRDAAATARAEAERAVAARNALLGSIDRQRDLAAQLVGELQEASERLRQQVANLSAGRPAEPVTVPFAAFRGALAWPARGRLTGTFGQTTNRLGGTAVRNGIELAVPDSTPVRAVHGGTVAYAEAFAGFGTLVIVEHGGDTYSLYGYLSSVSVAPGQTVEAGTEVGLSGTAPAGPPALYFEIRVDGRSVDPVQWLEPR